MFTKDKVKEIRTQIEAALATVGVANGIEFDLGNITFDSNSFGARLSATQIPTDGKSIEQAEFEKLCAQYGVYPEDYGRTFTEGGLSYALVGFLPRGRKYQAKVRREDKEYKVTLDAVHRGFGQ